MLVKKIFGVNLLVMQVLGFYPPRKHRKLYKLYSFFVYCFFTVLLPVLSSLYLITDPEINLEKIADNAFMTCELGCFISKMIPFLINDKEIRNIIYMIEHPVFMAYRKHQEKIIQDCEKICKRTTWLLFNSCIVCFVCFVLEPLLEKGYKLPMDIWLPYDISENMSLYIISFVYVVAGVLNSAFSNGAIDTLIAGLAYYATSQIKILKNNLENLNKHVKIISGDGAQRDEEKKLKIIYNRVKLCVQHHSVIIEFVDNYERIYSSVAFTQFSASVIVICICFFRLSQIELSSLQSLMMITFFNIMLSQIFLYCYFGTTLYEENNTLAQAVYMGEWYEYDVQSQKALMILMERSKRPMIVTAGKILDLSLETFTTILRRAYSLLAVLKNY